MKIILQRLGFKEVVDRLERAKRSVLKRDLNNRIAELNGKRCACGGIVSLALLFNHIACDETKYFFRLFCLSLLFVCERYGKPLMKKRR